MSHFDPYHKWLGIPPEQQPPNYYQLLGIQPFEADPDVINIAAESRLELLRNRRTDENAVICQKIHNEISVARDCLLNPQQHAEYDASLQQRSAGGLQSIQDFGNALSTDLFGSPAPMMSPMATPVALQKRTQRWLLPAIAGIAALLLVGAGGALFVLFSGQRSSEVVKKVGGRVQDATASNTSASTIEAKTDAGQTNDSETVPETKLENSETITTEPPTNIPATSEKNEVASVDPIESVSVDLLELIDLQRDVVAGDWVVDNGVLQPVRNEPSHIQIPYDLPTEYDLIIEAKRRSGAKGLFVGLVAEQQPFQVVINGARYTTGLHLLDKKIYTRNKTSHAKKYTSYTYLIQVRKTGIAVMNELAVLIDYRDEVSRLSLEPDFSFPDEGKPQISFQDDIFQIKKIHLNSGSWLTNDFAKLDSLKEALMRLEGAPVLQEPSVEAVVDLAGHTKPVTGVAFSSDGKTVASCSEDTTVVLWDVTSRTTRHVLKGHNDKVAAVAFSSDGTLLASAGADGTVRLWDVNAATQRQVLQGHSGPVHNVKFSVSGGLLASSGEDGNVIVWDGVTGKRKYSLERHESPVLGIGFSSDGKQLASCSVNGKIKIWDVASAKETEVKYVGHINAITSVGFTHDGKHLLSCSRDFSSKFWDASSGIRLLTFRGHRGQVNCGAFSPDGEHFATCGKDNKVTLRETSGGRRVASFQAHKSGVSRIAFGPKGEQLATAGGDRHVKIWNIANMLQKNDQTVGSALNVIATANTDFKPDSAGHADTANLGVWSFKSSPTANPVRQGASLTDMKWKAATTGPHYVGVSKEFYGQYRPTIAQHRKGIVMKPGDGTFPVVRWTSDDSGYVNVSGRFQKALAQRGDGVEVYAFVDGTPMFYRPIHYNNSGEVTFDFDAYVAPKTVVDFVVGSDGPGRVNDTIEDETYFDVKISRLPLDSGRQRQRFDIEAKVQSLMNLSPKSPIASNSEGKWVVGDSNAKYKCGNEIYIEAYKKLGGTDTAALKFLDEYNKTGSQVQGAMTSSRLQTMGESLFVNGLDDPVFCFAYSQVCSWVARERTSTRAIREQMYERARTAILRAISNKSIESLPFIAFEAHIMIADLFGYRMQPIERTHHINTAIEKSIQAISLKNMSKQRRQFLLYQLRGMRNTSLREASDRYYGALQSSPDADPWIVKMLVADKLHDDAWAFRGHGLANTVTSEGWRLFFSQMNRSRASLLDAWNMRPDHSEAAAKLVSVALAYNTRRPINETPRFWFDQAVSADIDNTDAYTNLMYAMNPKWGGSNEQLLEFGKECLASKRFDTEVPFYFHRTMMSVGKQLGMREVLRMPGVYETYKSMLGGYMPTADKDRKRRINTRMLAAAWLTGERDLAKRLVRNLGSNVDKDTLSEFRTSLQLIMSSLAIQAKPAETYRLWTSADGKFTVQANVVKTIEGGVRLKRDNGQVVDIPLSKLSEADQKHVKHYATDSLRIRAVRQYEGHEGIVAALTFSSNSQQLATAGVDGTVRLWNVEGGEQLKLITGHEGPVVAVSISPDGKRVVSGSWDHTMRMWDLQSGEQLKSVTGHKLPIFSVAFAKNGQQAMMGSCCFQIWDLDLDQSVKCMQGHTKPVASVAFSPDGRFGLTGSSDETIRLWDLASGKERRILVGHRGRVNSVRFGPNGKFAVSGAMDDNEVRHWDLTTGVLVHKLRGHKNGVSCVAYSADGRWLASGSGRGTPDGGYDLTVTDGAVHIWNTASGKGVARIAGHSSFITGVEFSPNGKYLATSSGDGTARLWELAE